MFRRPTLRASLAVAIAFAVLCSLGTWQVFRLRDKEALLAAIASRAHAPPRPLEQVLRSGVTGDRLVFTRVQADCPGLGAAPYQRVYAIDRGRAGERLISACALAAGPWSAVLMDRGFVADTVKRLPVIAPGDPAIVHVTGVLRAGEHAGWFTPKHTSTSHLWFFRDLPGIAAALGVPRPAPLFLAAETSSNPDLPTLEPSAIPSDIPNRHLGYIFTWYGLALALIGVFAGTLYRPRQPKP